MKFRNIDTFYWVATLGSFRAAADKLNLTQPAISARIQVLEQDLGVAVFIRDSKSAELTVDGRKLLTYAERLMVLEQDTLAAFSDTTPVKQTIRVGSSETIVSTWLPDFLSELNQSEFGITFELTVDGTNNLRDALVNREIDLAFLMGPVSEAHVTNCELCAYEMVFAATAELAVKHKNWSLQTVSQERILTFASTTKPSIDIAELLKPYRSGGPDMTTSTALGALVRLATKGYGVCAMPKAVIHTELDSGELKQLQTNVMLPAIAFTASYMVDSPMSVFLSRVCSEVTQFLEPRLIKNIYQG